MFVFDLFGCGRNKQPKVETDSPSSSSLFSLCLTHTPLLFPTIFSSFPLHHPTCFLAWCANVSFKLFCRLGRLKKENHRKLFPFFSFFSNFQSALAWPVGCNASLCLPLHALRPSCSLHFTVAAAETLRKPPPVQVPPGGGRGSVSEHARPAVAG